MSYIEIDSRGCGAGKTRNTIIPRIRNNIRNNIRSLVVVPSIDLQREYAAHFMWDEITVINSEGPNKDGVYTQYQQADTPVICMTHEGFLRTPHTLFEKINTDLIIDEAVAPYSLLEFKTYDSAGRVWLNTDELFAWRNPEIYTLPKPTKKPQPFFELEVVGSTPPDIINRELWHKLTNPNYRLWATWETGNNLFNRVNEKTRLVIDLNPDILRGWSTVWIAAAVFEQTLMGAWLESNRLEYTVEYPFVPHTGPAVFHIPEEEFSWSKNYKNQNPEIARNFREYCESNRNGRLIYNSNNDDNTVMYFGTRITHNAHGVNAYKHLTDYAFMSAIKPNPQLKNFILDQTALDKQQLEFGFAGYMAYQLVMRTALRDPSNTTPVNLFFLDTEQARGIMDLFDKFAYETKLIHTIQGNKSRPLTRAERHARWRAKQKTS